MAALAQPENTMAFRTPPSRFAPLRFAAVALLLAGCPKPPPEGLLTDAHGALALAADAERCAPAEYRAAARLVEQAQAAYEAKDYKAAERFANAARAQADKAREAASQNPACREGGDEPAIIEPEPPADDIGMNAGMDATASESASSGEGGPHTWTTIYFDFDSFEISTGASQILSDHAAWLKLNPAVSLTVTGHCDEAGSTEYNLALGERRARVVVNYLASLGLDRNRLRVVSYGEEMPASDKDNLNRRAEFKVKGR
jgi:peptidoglycan-associated lipoprotein